MTEWDILGGKKVGSHERAGPLRIYKTVPHDVAFLQSGAALRPLLPKTRCWNVDAAQFVLQLRPGSYWRVEILGCVPIPSIQSQPITHIHLSLALFLPHYTHLPTHLPTHMGRRNTLAENSPTESAPTPPAPSCSRYYQASQPTS